MLHQCQYSHTHTRTPNLQGNWAIFGMVLKLVKNMAKHEGPCMALARNPNMGRLLLGVARLLARLPEQRKLLKVRVSDMHGQAAPGWGILEQRRLLKVRAFAKYLQGVLDWSGAPAGMRSAHCSVCGAARHTHTHASARVLYACQSSGTLLTVGLYFNELRNPGINFLQLLFFTRKYLWMICRVGQNYIYTVRTIYIWCIYGFFAGMSSNIRSYSAYIYGCGQP